MVVPNRCSFSQKQIICNKYIVKKQLGEGAFGIVYKVNLLNDPSCVEYALKILKLWEVPENIRQGLVDRFEMEYKTGQISSDYLVHSLDYGMVEGNPFFVMEFCPFGDLSQFIENRNQMLDSQLLTKYSSHILMGLHDLHSSGKVHRDLKPENVLLKNKEWAALTDFGISGDRNKRMTERNILGKPMQIFGTYAYMPPEQVQRIKGDATVLPTTDFFSFGVMLYQLLTGYLPFGELNDHNDLVLYQQNAIKGKWNKQVLNSPNIHAQWLAIIEACLVPDYQFRIQKSSDLLRMLPNCQNFISNSFQSDGHNFLLRVMQGENYGEVFKLNELTNNGKLMITIGRETDNSIYLQELQSCYISRKHCTIEYEPESDRWFIRDGQWRKSYEYTAGSGGWHRSTNGTYVNSTEASDGGTQLHSGDIISIGEVKLRVENY